MVTLFRVYDDPDLDGELAYEPEDDDDVEAENAHTLSIRRASGEEVLTVFSPNEEWSVYLRGHHERVRGHPERPDRVGQSNGTAGGARRGRHLRHPHRLAVS